MRNVLCTIMIRFYIEINFKFKMSFMITLLIFYALSVAGERLVKDSMVSPEKIWYIFNNIYVRFYKILYEIVLILSLLSN